MTKLKPCPFCGAVKSAEGVRIIEQGHISSGLRACDYRVQCLKCYCMTFQFDDKQKAIDAWNTRVEN